MNNSSDPEVLTFRNAVSAGDHIWEITTFPSLQSFIEYAGLFSWTAFLSILVVISLISYFIFRITSNNLKAAALVEQQTKSLREYAEKLHETQNLHKAILENTVDGLITINEKGIVQSYNKACKKIFGYESDEVIGQNISMLMPRPYRQEHDSYLKNYLHSGKAKIIGIGREVEGKRKDGKVFPIDLSVSKVEIEGKILFSGIVRDITPRKKAEKKIQEYTEKLEISNRDLDDFAHIASHDLKEPLRGLYNYAEFLREDYYDKLDSEGQHKLDTLQKLARRMEALIESLLDYSRLSRIDMASKKTDLDEILKTVLETLEIWLKEKNAEVSIKKALPSVVCDPVKVGEVFRNLITNAVKYNDEPVKKIEIGYIKNHEDWGDIPVFYVKDNGIGIAENHKEQVFKIFKRLHGREDYGGGTGVGLTIIWKIIERHGGKIWIEPNGDKGTIFFFTLRRNENGIH